jgi:hypothetical protein
LKHCGAATKLLLPLSIGSVALHNEAAVHNDKSISIAWVPNRSRAYRSGSTDHHFELSKIEIKTTRSVFKDNTDYAAMQVRPQIVTNRLKSFSAI